MRSIAFGIECDATHVHAPIHVHIDSLHTNNYADAHVFIEENCTSELNELSIHL